jgi:hypothetical protein
MMEGGRRVMRNSERSELLSSLEEAIRDARDCTERLLEEIHEALRGAERVLHYLALESEQDQLELF